MESNVDTIQTVISKTHLPHEIDFRAGGLILVDKPKEWTSFDVVNKIRFAIRHKLGVKKFKVGHAGTLDPLATGLLLICYGKYTKKIEHLAAKNKSYEGILKLGATTASYDAEMPEENIKPLPDNLTQEKVNQVLDAFRGESLQSPPMFSALKVDGVRLYKKARKGESIEVKKRKINISEISLSEMDLPFIILHCTVSKGTYIRSLAYDIGEVLGCGAYLADLKRTSIDSYNNEHALTVEEVVKWIEKAQNVE